MRSLTILVLAALAAIATACVSPDGGSAPAATAGDRDARFYEGRCGVCHAAFDPGRFRRNQWPSILEAMAPRAGLSATQRDRVLRYVLAGAKDAPR